MRNLFAACFSAVFGVAVVVPGIALALWVGLAAYRVELGFDCILWALEHSPFALSATPLELANRAIQRNALIGAGLLAAFLCWTGYGSLRWGRDALRPEGESSGGKAKLALETPVSRVGRPVEGSLRLTQDAKPGQMYCLELSCSRTHTPVEGKARKETAFFATQDVAAVQDSDGWHLPFSFDVPVTAPPTGAGANQFAQGGAIEPYGWSLAFYPADSVIAFPSRVALSLAAAPEEELRAAEARETPEQKAAIEAIAEQLEPARGALLPHEREQLRTLSPADLAMVRKGAAMPGKIMATMGKWLAIFFVAIPLLVMLMFFVVGALLK